MERKQSLKTDSFRQIEEVVSSFEFETMASFEDFFIFCELRGIDIDSSLVEWCLKKMSFLKEEKLLSIFQSLDKRTLEYFSDDIVKFLISFEKQDGFEYFFPSFFSHLNFTYHFYYKLFKAIENLDETFFPKFYIRNRDAILTPNVDAFFSFTIWLKNCLVSKSKKNIKYKKIYLIVLEDLKKIQRSQMYLS